MAACSKSEVPSHGNCLDQNAHFECMAQLLPNLLEKKQEAELCKIDTKMY